MDHFITVTRKSRPLKNKKQSEGFAYTLPEEDQDSLVRRGVDNVNDKLSFIKTIQDKVLEMFKQQKVKPREIVCLGLGSLRYNRSAQVQLALLVLLCRYFQCPARAYDPIFSAVDHGILEAFGVQPEKEDLAGRYLFQQPTLAYMPHCGLPLYERLLRTNFTPSQLSNTLLLCNRLEQYVLNTPAAKLEKKAPALVRILPYLKVWELPNLSAPHSEALNDLCLHILSPSSDLDLDLPPEPTLPKDQQGNEILH